MWSISTSWYFHYIYRLFQIIYSDWIYFQVIYSRLNQLYYILQPLFRIYPTVNWTKSLGSMIFFRYSIDNNTTIRISKRRDVFDYFYTTLVMEDDKNFVPEKIFKNVDFEVENYPINIPYADMSGNTTEEKLRLLDNWEY